MATAILGGKSIEVNDEGFITNQEDWSKEIALDIAKNLGIEMTDRHWVVVNYMREDYAKTKKSPTVRRITQNTDVNTKELYALFPGGPGKKAANIAGVPKPAGCV